MSHVLLLAFALALFGAGAAAQASVCPPPDYDSVQPFNLSSYIAEPWYVLAQAPLVYQSRDELFCVRARYTPMNEGNLLEGLDVFNSANRGGVDGPRVEGSDLVAVPDTPSSATGNVTANATGSDPSKLRVGPAPLLPLLRSGDERAREAFGPYWVVATSGSSSHGNQTNYDWAIITGGPPFVPTELGCRTGRPGPLETQYYGGLWLFSRDPMDADGNKAVMISKAQEMGLDTSVLMVVEQEGCTYPEP